MSQSLCYHGQFHFVCIGLGGPSVAWNVGREVVSYACQGSDALEGAIVTSQCGAVGVLLGLFAGHDGQDGEEIEAVRPLIAPKDVAHARFDLHSYDASRLLATVDDVVAMYLGST